MIRAHRVNATAQDDSGLISGWNVAPNLAYSVALAPGPTSCGVFLFADAGHIVASGAAIVGAEQPCVLIPQSGQTIGMIDAELGWHLLLTTVGTEQQRTIRINPAVDLPDEIHPIYADDALALVRATAGIDASAHYIDELAVSCPLGLGAGLGDVANVPVDGVAVVGQVESLTWTGTPNGASEQVVIRRHVAIAPVPAVAPPTPPVVVDDAGETTADETTSGNALANDEPGLTVTAVNGLSANVGGLVAGSEGGVFVIGEDGNWTFDPDGDFGLLEGSETTETSVTYHASNGQAEAGATLTITVSSGDIAPVLWTPAEITTALWLDASDSSTITLESSTVSQWADKSGQNRHATQGASSAMPTVSAAALNGLSVLTFDGTNDFLTLGTVLGRPANYTVFAVSRLTKALSSAQAVIASMMDTGESKNSCLTMVNDAGKCFWNYGNGSDYRWGYPNGAFTLNTFAQHCLIHTHGTQNEAVFRDGALLTNAGLAGTATANSGAAQTTSIGRLGGFNGWYLGGDVAEVVVLLSSAPVDTRQKVEGYLAHKWGMNSSLPSGHPYKENPPTI